MYFHFIFLSLVSISEYAGGHGTNHMWVGGVLENGTWHWGDIQLTWIPWKSGTNEPNNNVYHTYMVLRRPYSGTYLFTAPGGDLYIPFCQQSNDTSGLYINIKQ